MLQKAVEHYNSVGRVQALADFNGGKAPFIDRDLYVACINSHLALSANGGFPNLVGSTLEPISRAAWDAATSTQISSVNYQWLNPVSGKTEPKTFYYEKVGIAGCGVGTYHP
jgi:cytochrome c